MRRAASLFTMLMLIGTAVFAQETISRLAYGNSHEGYIRCEQSVEEYRGSRERFLSVVRVDADDIIEFNDEYLFKYSSERIYQIFVKSKFQMPDYGMINKNVMESTQSQEYRQLMQICRQHGAIN